MEKGAGAKGGEKGVEDAPGAASKPESTVAG